MARIFISTGEVSGDLQGALLIEALRRQATARNVALDLVGLGGTRMAQVGATLLGDTTGIGSVGLLESVPYILPTLQIQQTAKEWLRSHPPDVAILIDYMGPNLSIGSYIRRHLPSVPIIWYIAPQVWVWSPPWQDVERIVELSHRILAIFPEEARYFEQKGAQVSWVGHPLIDRMQAAPSRDEARQKLGIDPDTLAIALIPASRQQEIKYLMPVIFEAAQIIQDKLPQVSFWIPLSREAYRPSLQQAIETFHLRAQILENQSLEVLAAADLAIAKSGTVNLETALLNIPQVVAYRVSAFTYWVARRVLKFSIPFMSPPNLIQMQAIVPELLQEQATADNIASAAIELLVNTEKRQQTLADYQAMRKNLGEAGACDRAACEILDLIL